MTIWRWERTNSFPRHLTLGGRNFWRETEVAAWINANALRRTGGHSA
jgi:predicted DNA-binding transcriptional regulator AlpA